MMNLDSVRDKALKKYHLGIQALKHKVLGDDLPNRELPTKDLLEAFGDRYSFADVLPYERYDDENGLYFNHDSYGFVLYCQPSTGLVETDLSILQGILRTQFVENSTVQISLIADPNIDFILNNWRNNKNKANSDIQPMFKLMADNRVEYLKKGKWQSLIKGQPFVLRNYHLVVSYTQPIPSYLEKEELNTADIDSLQRLKSTFLSALNSANIASMELLPEPLINLLSNIINPSKDDAQYVRYDDFNYINDQIVDPETTVFFGAGGANINTKGGEYSVMPFHVRQYPRQWTPYNNQDLIGDSINDVLRIGCPFILTLSIHAPEPISTKSKATATATRTAQMTDSPIAKVVPQWADRNKDWQFAVDAIDNGEQLLESCFQIILFSEKGEERKVEQNILSLYSSLGWVVSRSRYTALHALIHSLPMGAGQDVKKSMRKFKFYKKMLSSNCVNIAPWVAEFKGNSSPIMLFAGRKGQLAYFDPFQNKKGNYNIACTATSGSGKSFFTQDWVYGILGAGGRAFILDAGHSYRNLCRLMNGTYIDFGEVGKRLCFNPFTNISTSSDAIEVEADIADKYQAVSHFEEQLQMIKLLIIQMANGGTEVLTRKQEAFIEKAIQNAWSKHKNKACVDDVINELKEDKTDEGTAESTPKGLAVMLYSWSREGQYSRYVNGENTIDLDNDFVVMDLDALNKTKDLQSVAVLMLIMQITQVMYLSGRKDQPKLAIIDEAWRLMGESGGTAAEAINEGYRVARKHGGSFMTITQGITDYFASPSAFAAYSNSDFTIFLRQKPDVLTKAVADGNLDNSDGKVDLLRTLKTLQGEYSELAISSPDGLSIYRFLTDKVTGRLYSTTPKDVQFILNALSNGVKLLDAVQMLLEEDENNGVA